MASVLFGIFMAPIIIIMIPLALNIIFDASANDAAFEKLAVTSESWNANDYCHIKSCMKHNLDHTVCVYQKPGPGKTCPYVIHVGLSKQEKQSILKYHNELRHKVASGKETRGSPGPQPPAKHMPVLKWDDEVAMIAQRWTDQCTYGHDPCRNTEKSVVGQNIALISTTRDIGTVKYNKLIKAWYDEVKDFPREGVFSHPGRGVNNAVVGHYTQIVWGNTTHLGCGAIKFKEGESNTVYLVCNYSPTGNYFGKPVYVAA